MPLNTPTTPKLTEEQVLTMRARVEMRDIALAINAERIKEIEEESRNLRRNHCNKVIAHEHGIAENTVSKIIRRETWRHI